MPDHWALIYFQTFTAGQRNYWNYYSEVGMRSRLFATQIGRMDAEGEKDGKATRKGPSCYTCYFKNGSKIEMPAGGFDRDATSQAGINTNDLYIDEFTKIDGTGSTGIDDQLIGRARRQSFNQDHPFWCNHHLLTATAEDTMHPAYDRYMAYKRQVDAGNPDYCIINYSVKDFSNKMFDNRRAFREVLRDDRMMKDLKTNKTASSLLQEGYGIWSANGKGWYTTDLVNQCYRTGRDRKADVLCGFLDEIDMDAKRRRNVFYFMGADPAPADQKKADDGALVVGRAEALVPRPTSNITDWRFDYCWAYKVRKADASQWAGIIHRKQRAFQFSMICCDSQGGGQWIRPELGKERQVIQNKEAKVTPIACVEDEATMSLACNFILSMFKIVDTRIKRLWGDLNLRHPSCLIDVAHTELLTAMTNGIVGLPERMILRPSGEVGGWSEEKKHANQMLDLMADQMKKICVRTENDGKTFRNRFGAREFSAKGKRDFAYAGMYCFTAFLAWLKAYDEMSGGLKPEDRAGGDGGGSSARSSFGQSYIPGGFGITDV